MDKGCKHRGHGLFLRDFEPVEGAELSFFFFLIVVVFFFFVRATPAAYGGTQAGVKLEL